MTKFIFVCGTIQRTFKNKVGLQFPSDSAAPALLCGLCNKRDMYAAGSRLYILSNGDPVVETNTLFVQKRTLYREPLSRLVEEEVKVTSRYRNGKNKNILSII